MRAVLRLVQLWLQNADAADAAPELDAVFQKVLSKVPCHKLLYLAYQMTSRVSLQDSPFQKLLWKVVTRMAVEHPHHVLLHLLCLETHSSSSKQGAAQQLLQVTPLPAPDSQCPLCTSVMCSTHATLAFLLRQRTAHLQSVRPCAGPERPCEARAPAKAAVLYHAVTLHCPSCSRSSRPAVPGVPPATLREVCVGRRSPYEATPPPWHATRGRSVAGMRGFVCRKWRAAHRD